MESASVDPEIKALDAALVARGEPRAVIGRLLDLDSKQVHRLFNGQRRLQRHEFKRVDDYLGGTLTERQNAAVVPIPGLVPLFGWVGAASDQRLTLAEQSVRGYVSRHPNQANLREAFALQVSDVSMIPRYEPGEVVYVAPNVWPKRGEDCVLVTTDSYGYLKRYVSRDAQRVVTFQFNPEQELLFDIDHIAAVHAVVGRG